MNTHIDDPLYLENKNFYENYINEMKIEPNLTKYLVKKNILKNSSNKEKKETIDNLKNIKEKEKFNINDINKNQEIINKEPTIMYHNIYNNIFWFDNPIINYNINNNNPFDNLINNNIKNNLNNNIINNFNKNNNINLNINDINSLNNNYNYMNNINFNLNDINSLNNYNHMNIRPINYDPNNLFLNKINGLNIQEDAIEKNINFNSNLIKNQINDNSFFNLNLFSHNIKNNNFNVQYKNNQPINFFNNINNKNIDTNFIMHDRLF